jgi:hypothetical protein
MLTSTCSNWLSGLWVPLVLSNLRTLSLSLNFRTGGHLGNQPGPSPHVKGTETQVQRDISRVIQPARSRPHAHSHPGRFWGHHIAVTRGQLHNRPGCVGGPWEQRDMVDYEFQQNEPPRTSKSAVESGFPYLLGDESPLGHLSKIKIPRLLPNPTEPASLRGGTWEAEFLKSAPCNPQQQSVRTCLRRNVA